MYTHIFRRSNICDKSSGLLLIDSFAAKYNTIPMPIDYCRNLITHRSKSLYLFLRRVLHSPYSDLMISACKKEKKQNQTKPNINETKQKQKKKQRQQQKRIVRLKKKGEPSKFGILLCCFYIALNTLKYYLYYKY